MKNYWYILLFCFALNVSVAQQNGIQFNEDKTWEQVLTLAKEENKVVFLDAYTTWCGPCKKMTRDIFPLKSVADVYNEKFINVKMDMEKGDGVNVANRYNIRAFPTLLYVNAEGEVVHRVAGYQNEAQMLQLAKDAFDPLSQLATLKKKYNEGNRDANFLFKYAYAAQKALEDRNYTNVANEYLETQTDWGTTKNMKFILDFVTRTDAKMFDYLMEHRAQFEETFDKVTVSRKINRLVSTRIDQLLSMKNNDDALIFDEALELFSKVNPGEGKARTASFKMTYYRQGGDRLNFANAAVEYVELMPEISADELSDIAWTFYEVIEDEALLKKALKWSKKALKMQKDVSYYDTVASLYLKLGNKRKAKKYAKRGIRFADANDEAHPTLDELLEAINM